MYNNRISKISRIVRSSRFVEKGSMSPELLLRKPRNNNTRSERVHLSIYSVVIPVRSAASSESFYTRLLHKPPHRRFASWVEYELNGSLLSLKEVPAAEIFEIDRTSPRLIFEVDRLDEAVYELSKEGFSFKKEQGLTEDGGRYANLVDPDKNIIGLYESA